MKIVFPSGDPQKAVECIASSIEDASLKKAISFSLSKEALVVSISKMGTSTLNFSLNIKEKECIFELKREKIALAHKIFKDEVKDEIKKTIKKAGGRVNE